MMLAKFVGARKRAGAALGLMLLAAVATVMATAAQSDGGGDMVTACIDSRNGAVYGARIDSDDVRCNRGDESISWTLGEIEIDIDFDFPDNSDGSSGSGGSSGSTGISFAGSWEPNVSYMRGIIIEHQGSSYISVSGNSNGVEPPSPGYWQIIALRGSDGEAGPQGEAGEDGASGEQGERGLTGQQGPFGLDGEGFAWRGDFDSASVPYERNDVVHHEGSAWIAIVEDATGYPDESIDWDLFVSGGLDDSGGGNGAADSGGSSIYRLTEIIPGSELTGHNVHAEVACPESAPHIVGGGFQIVTSNEAPFFPASSQIDQLKGNGPILSPDGPDLWRVSWFTTTGNINTTFMKIDISCTDAVNDL
jgi:hypothetical protein